MRTVLGRSRSGRRIGLAAAVSALALIPTPLASAAGTGAAGGAAAPTAANVNTIKMPTIATAGAPTSTSTTNTAPTGSTTTAKPTGGAFGLAKTPGNTTGVRRRASAGKLSTGAVLAAVIGGLLALVCIVWAALRWSAVEPRWTLPLRHSMAEAGFRASSVWAEFTDWIRLGH